jgi:cyclic pyranopterin phosphate synthase
MDMVDVGDKEVTRREAVATGRLRLGETAFAALRDGRLPKGDALAAAHVAAVTAVKCTAAAIPLCHPVPVEHVGVAWELDASRTCVEVRVTVRARARTGVEMEALHGVALFLLTVYDMAKTLDKGLVLEDVRLLSKSGGRSGDWQAGQAAEDTGGPLD